jgi:hypothetical protein
MVCAVEIEGQEGVKTRLLEQKSYTLTSSFANSTSGEAAETGGYEVQLHLEVQSDRDLMKQKMCGSAVSDRFR